MNSEGFGRIRLRKGELREVKREIRIVGIECCPPLPSDKFVPVVGVVYRGKWILDGILETKIKVGGLDSTEKIAEMIMKSSHYDQIRVIVLDNVNFAEGNLIDLEEFHERIKRPVIFISKEKLDLDAIERAIRKYADWEERLRCALSVKEQHRFKLKESIVYLRVLGMDYSVAKRLIEQMSIVDAIPEALRIAKLIAGKRKI